MTATCLCNRGLSWLPDDCILVTFLHKKQGAKHLDSKICPGCICGEIFEFLLQFYEALSGL